MKKFIKYLMMLVVFITVISSICVVSNAATWTMNSFSTMEKSGSMGKAGTATHNVMGTIIQTIKIVGTAISIIMITYVAIKYMTAAPSEKAEFKKSATAFIVGAVVLFAASQIVGIIQNFATNNVKDTVVKDAQLRLIQVVDKNIKLT